MKLLLYCTKGKPYLYINRCVLPTEFDRYILSKEQYYSAFGEPLDKLNGKIVAECDFEVEEIFYELYGDLDWQHEYLPTTDTMFVNDLANASCLDKKELNKYCDGYAIYIKNLHIFDKPKELTYYDKYKYVASEASDEDEPIPVEKAPQNMMYCYEEGEKKVLVSFHPDSLCKILKGEKTIDPRKVVLKEML